MGCSYIGCAGSYHSIGDNLSNVEKDFERHGNHFGTKSSEGSSNVYEIFNKDQHKAAKDFYDRIAYGGVVILNLPSGQVAKMKDGTIITYRDATSSYESPAVSINVRESSDNFGIKTHKIHFIKEI